ncbi:glycosyltransferase family 25 protein [Stenoxybacter acetivorans]|uniref:glycosyltransferase family 25 protein n=1 Tax=Stenoxybacter acetivorans TaxID=422441 RepID=UPI00068F90F1|nr:glycosyltransferase family 25 protein [Stenoxybacter acetivorans]
MIPALLINLPQSTDRLAFQAAQLKQLGITWQRMNATTIADISTAEYERLAKGWERPLRSAEVACFLSHQRAWQTVLQENRPMLILEDDALLSAKTPLLLENLSACLTDADYITLETRARKKLLDKHSTAVNPDFALRRLYQDRTGAAAYILFPQGAQKLLDKAAHENIALADAFICRAYELNAYQTVPAAAIQLDRCEYYRLNHIQNPFASTITPSNNQKPAAGDFAAAARFKYRRIAAQCRMGIRQLSVLGKAQREYVGINTADFRQPEITVL